MALTQHEDLAAELQRLRASFNQELPSRINRINTLWRIALSEHDNEATKECLNILHRLAGSGASFGRREISISAREAEVLLQSYINRPDLLHEIEDQFSTLITQLTKQVELPSDSELVEPPEIPPPPSNADYVLLLHDDEKFAGQFKDQLKAFATYVKLVSEVEQFIKVAEEAPPKAMIVDSRLNGDDTAGFAAIEKLKAMLAIECPILVLSNLTDFEAKLKAERVGANAYFVHPVDTAMLMAELERLTAKFEQTDALRIMMIDDDDTLAKYYSTVLARAGMLSHTVSNPADACEAIGEFRPDVILIDLYMPVCNGMELANVIRFHPQYLHIPLVFLSTESMLEVQLQAMRTGGDDFLVKPISPQHLVEALRVRAARARRITNLISQDSLTGLLKHAMIKERLKVEYARAQRTGTHFCFAMLDIDLFKHVNDSYGHMMGDKVISTLARILKNRVRAGDSVGRYGGEEFALLLQDCDVDDAREIVESLRNVFAKQPFVHEGDTFHVTLSGGIVCSEDADSSDDMCKLADKALYVAKKNGRNRVETYHP